MTELKMFKIDGPVCMQAGEDALYVVADRIYKYVPALDCHVIKYSTAHKDICECSNCKETLWTGGYKIENMHHMPKYCKWCGAKIVWEEPKEEVVDWEF